MGRSSIGGVRVERAARVGGCRRVLTRPCKDPAADAQGPARRRAIPSARRRRRRIALLPPTHLHHHAVDRHDRGRPDCVWWFACTEKVSTRPSARSMNPEREFTPPMLPSFARTRPSSGVPTNRLRSEPTPPDCGSPARKVGARGCDRMKRRIWVKASGLTRFPLERPGAVLQRELGRVDPDRIDQEAALHRQPLRPTSPRGRTGGRAA